MNTEIDITEVKPIDTYVQPNRADILRKELERQQQDLQPYRKKKMDNNKWKSIIAAVVAFLVQISYIVFQYEVPEIVVNGITMVLVFVVGLFLPEPNNANK
jgi:membrane-anchored glycerophosphoryl diester phosphodiesterase (GDPDase)